MFISDCVLVTSEEGHFYYKATGDESTVCGVYLLTDPDKMVEIYFDYLDVPCQTGGLISVSFSSKTFMYIGKKIQFNLSTTCSAKVRLVLLHLKIRIC